MKNTTFSGDTAKAYDVANLDLMLTSSHGDEKCLHRFGVKL